MTSKTRINWKPEPILPFLFLRCPGVLRHGSTKRQLFIGHLAALFVEELPGIHRAPGDCFHVSPLTHVTSTLSSCRKGHERMNQLKAAALQAKEALLSTEHLIRKHIAARRPFYLHKAAIRFPQKSARPQPQSCKAIILEGVEQVKCCRRGCALQKSTFPTRA